MAYYVMVGKSVYPAVFVENLYREHLPRPTWINGQFIDFEIPQPIVYDLDIDEHDTIPNVKILDDTLPIPYMHDSIVEALLAVGVDNIQFYDAVIRDLKRNVDHTDFKAFNVVGLVSAADMSASTMMGTSNSTLIDADFDRLVLDEEKCAGKLLFRLAENITAIVVSEVVKNEVQKRGIKGVMFYPSGEWAG
ncbi:MAG: hypothetical protein RL497_3145 [Pseudomonadota bacterium]|jgi:hypothetical protein